VTPKLVEILLIEDSPGDVRLTREALKDARVVSDGEQALAYLHRAHPFENAARPDLILLDLNLPKVDGREVLAAIKTDPSLQLIPVVVLTTSRAEEDVLKSYSLHANCFITKPVELDKFIEVVRSIEGFWLAIVHLPRD
jgi:CheY-like chemotaxis protein